jgi:molybdopterin synthase sulfur carrier subunit
MLHIVFFARVKEELGCSGLELQWNEHCLTVRALKDQLSERVNGSWRDVLSEDNLICAVNHSVVDDAWELVDNDEVAFFPPVTGG